MRNIEKIKADFVEYTDLIDKIGENKIKERLYAIHDVYQIFLEDSGYIDQKDILLNDQTVIHIIMDYFTDITRLKEFHNISKINYDKIIAYEISWLLRRKPIQVLKDFTEDLVYINEKFALTIFINHLTSGKIDSISNTDGLSKLCDVMLYYFKYRNCDAKVLEMFIMCFKVGNSIEMIQQQ
jgi:hypothetical protein